MAFKQFSAVQYIKVFDTGEEVKAGSFLQTQNNAEIQYMRVGIYVNGNLSGNEQIRVNMYSNPGANRLLFRSSWSDISNCEDENGNKITGDWIGLIRCDFARQNINKNINYYPSVELNNYTRNADTFYIGLTRDYPFPRYTGGNTHYSTNYTFELFEYRKL